MEYIFRSDTFNQIDKLFDVKWNVLTSACERYPSIVTHWKNTGRVPLSCLITICNCLRVPISFFVQPKGMASEPRRMQTGWKPITNDFGKFFVRYSRVCHLTKTEISVNACVSLITLNKWFGDEQAWKKVTIEQFLSVCNNCQIYPGDFIHDENRPIKMIPEYMSLGNSTLVTQKIPYFHRRFLTNIPAVETNTEKPKEEEKNDSYALLSVELETTKQLLSKYIEENLSLKAEVASLKQKLARTNTSYPDMAAEDT